MNWLAHTLLSEPSSAFRIGNLLPDLLGPQELQGLPAEFGPGIERHRVIDAFTDSNFVVHRSIGRVGPDFRRFAGILTDIFYDHFLATDWKTYSDVPLESFVREVYAAVDALRDYIPASAFARLKRMGAEDWLGSYRQIAGVRHALRRIGGRLRKPVELADAVSVLELNYEDFRQDFVSFFPSLVAHIESLRPTHARPV
jgi:acyl carrier protein phosphodiesterase